jgi:hypothetical protein
LQSGSAKMDVQHIMEMLIKMKANGKVDQEKAEAN